MRVKRPEVKIPEVKIPEAKIPEVKIPEVKIPEVKILLGLMRVQSSQRLKINIFYRCPKSTIMAWTRD